MKKVSLMVLCVLCLVSFNNSLLAQPTSRYLSSSLQVLADKALEAYNNEDSVEFFEYYAESMKPVATSQYFKNMYVDSYKKDLGRLESKELLPAKSSLRTNFPVLAYEGDFENFDKVLITVNFKKEYDNYRITQIKFDKDYSAQSKWSGIKED